MEEIYAVLPVICDVVNTEVDEDGVILMKHKCFGSTLCGGGIGFPIIDIMRFLGAI